MTPEEKIRELAEIVGFCIDSLLAVVPHNHRNHLEYLRERAEALAEEDAE